MTPRGRLFRVEYSAAAVDHLRHLTARESGTVLDAVLRHLSHQPTTPARNRKLLRANPVAPWELRLGHLRVVTVRAVGVKLRERVVIGGREVDLG